MSFEKSSDNFREYLKKIKDVTEDKCCLCGKTPDMIRNEYFEYMKNPDAEFEDIGLDDLLIMTYKTKRPVCAACYFSIKGNEDLIREILTRPDHEIWNIKNDQ